jgi:hypothetical protein
MSDYCTLSDVKTYIGTAQTTDDTLISNLIPRASARIDAFCQRTFIARTETRYFDATADVQDRTLLVDDDLLAVTTLTNGDGTVLTASDYILLPSNATPKYGIMLKSSSGHSWTYTTDPENAISIAGSWGYKTGTVPPDDIKHAATRLTDWFYKQRSAPFETTGLPELGQIVVPSDMPPDISALLDPYRRLTL